MWARERARVRRRFRQCGGAGSGEARWRRSRPPRRRARSLGGEATPEAGTRNGLRGIRGGKDGHGIRQRASHALLSQSRGAECRGGQAREAGRGTASCRAPCRAAPARLSPGLRAALLAEARGGKEASRARSHVVRARSLGGGGSGSPWFLIFPRRRSCETEPTRTPASFQCRLWSARSPRTPRAHGSGPASARASGCGG